MDERYETLFPSGKLRRIPFKGWTEVLRVLRLKGVHARPVDRVMQCRYNGGGVEGVVPWIKMCRVAAGAATGEAPAGVGVARVFG